MGREEALDTALGQIERQFGKGAVMRMNDQAQVSIGAVSTGSLALDLALGIGGLPRGLRECGGELRHVPGGARAEEGERDVEVLARNDALRKVLLLPAFELVEHVAGEFEGEKQT